MTTIVATPRTTAPGLSLLRLHAMRGGYLLMGVGLALVKWPKLPDAHTMPCDPGPLAGARPSAAEKCEPTPRRRLEATRHPARARRRTGKLR